MQMNATEFKAKCLKLIDTVHDTGEPLTITKHGKPVVEIRPPSTRDSDPFDKLRGSVVEFVDPFEPSTSETDLSTSL